MPPKRKQGDEIRPPSSTLDILFDLCRLTDTITQIVKLRTANLTLTDDLDLGNMRGMDRENLLHANAKGHTTNRDGFLDATMLFRNDSTLKYLNSLARSFFN